MTVLKTVLERGYFPKELPPFFYTEPFASFATSKVGRAELKSFKPSDNYTEGVEYLLARPGQQIRPLAISHPWSFYRLARETARGIKRLLLKAHGSAFSRSAPVYSTSNYRAIHPRCAMGNLPREKASTRSGARYLLLADVSQFYPSLYTHAVGWAIDPRLRQRSFYKTKLPSNL